jgi:hypothetical protein
MAILSVKTDSIGDSGQIPKIIYITTNDSTETVLSPGYIDKLVAQGISFGSIDMALIATKESVSDTQFQLSFYNIARDINGEFTLSLAEASNIFEKIILENPQGNTITLQPPTSGLTNSTYTFPHSASSGVLTSDPFGVLSWVSVTGTGTVTSISQGAGLTCTPNPITTSGVVALSSTPVTAASYTYGDGGFTVDAYGRLTAASSATNIVTGVTAGTGLVSSGPATSPTLSVSSSVVDTLVIGSSGSTFNGSIAANTLTLNLPDAGLLASGKVNTTGQNFKGDKNLLGSWTIVNDASTATSLLNVTQNYNLGDCVVSQFYAPSLTDNSTVSSSFGYQASANNEVIDSFTKIGAGSVYNFSFKSLNDANFGAHTTQTSMKFGPTGASGDARGLGRSGLDGFDAIYPTFEYASESDESYPFVNLSSNIYPYFGNPCGIQSFSTYHADITDGIHACAATLATADNVVSGSLYGSHWIYVNQGGTLNPVLQCRSDGAIMTPAMSTVDPMGTLAGYDQACIAYGYNWEPNATLGPNVTGAEKYSSWWQRVGNIVTCYVKWKITVSAVSQGDVIEWYCDLPSNITGISLSNTDDLAGHVTFFKTPNFIAGTVVAEDNQHVKFTVICTQALGGDTFDATSSWSYVINP